ncbi:MAG: sigma-70 family RNA polymerase sigma factor [Ruminococcaceae bacterium]|nr:sigma-70 family RNA polymerase sigma factor [Oscillospiraceae bacterium]
MIEAAFSVLEDDGQRNELAAFYAEYKERFCCIAYSKLNNCADAEDAVQEVFSQIADKPDKFFEIPSDMRLAYVDVMVRNTAVDIFNAKNKVHIEELDEELEDDNVSLEDELFGKVSHDEILAFMEQLPTAQKNVLLLHCYVGLTIYETAQRLNISLNSANKRLKSARGEIKRFIDERSAENE